MKKGEKAITIVLLFVISIGLFSFFGNISLEVSNFQNVIPVLFIGLGVALIGFMSFGGAR